MKIGGTNLQAKRVVQLYRALNDSKNLEEEAHIDIKVLHNNNEAEEEHKSVEKTHQQLMEFTQQL